MCTEAYPASTEEGTWVHRISTLIHLPSPMQVLHRTVRPDLTVGYAMQVDNMLRTTIFALPDMPGITGTHCTQLSVSASLDRIGVQATEHTVRAHYVAAAVVTAPRVAERFPRRVPVPKPAAGTGTDAQRRWQQMRTVVLALQPHRRLAP
jgi:hypothetical protein